ncbi:esterase family protein [candidate division KSB1 bacterium]|nr:esterase family protein [candidate division KSB1 bacterium]
MFKKRLNSTNGTFPVRVRPFRIKISFNHIHRLQILLLAALLGVNFTHCQKLNNLAKGQKRLEYIHAPKMKLLIPASVFLPEEYYNSDKKKETRYPVVILLHGYGGDHAQWSRIADLKQMANKTKTILVCPDGGKDSWYFNTFSDTANFYYERHIIKEVITHIDTNYRTLGAKGRAITGLSMGGHGALRFVSLYPDSFVAAGSMSGILDLRVFPLSWNIAKRLGPMKDFPQRWKMNSCVNLVAQLQGKNKGILVECGKEDFALGVNRAYRDSAAVHHVKITYREDSGGHTSQFWKDHLEEHLNFLHNCFPKPKEE